MYKDDDGNNYKEKVYVSLDKGNPDSENQAAGNSGSEGFSTGLIAVIIIIAAGVGGVIYYSWKKQEKI